MEEIFDRMKESIEYAKRNNEDLDSASWSYQEGFLMSLRECQNILSYVEELKSKVNAD